MKTYKAIHPYFRRSKYNTMDVSKTARELHKTTYPHLSPNTVRANYSKFRKILKYFKPTDEFTFLGRRAQPKRVTRAAKVIIEEAEIRWRNLAKSLSYASHNPLLYVPEELRDSPLDKYIRENSYTVNTLLPKKEDCP